MGGTSGRGWGLARVSGPDWLCPAEAVFGVEAAKTAGGTLARPESPLDMDRSAGLHSGVRGESGVERANFSYFVKQVIRGPHCLS